MRIGGIEWDAANRKHILRDHAERNIAMDDVDDVLLGRCAPARSAEIPRQRTDEPRRIVFGKTCDGRHLKIIVAPRPDHIFRPVTAWPMSEREVRAYDAWRRTIKR